MKQKVLANITIIFHIYKFSTYKQDTSLKKDLPIIFEKILIDKREENRIKQSSQLMITTLTLIDTVGSKH